MKGFADRALLLFPKLESYEQRSYEYKNNFKLALTNLLDYLLSRGIEPHVLYTDDVARELYCPSMHYVSTLGPGDLFFASVHCMDMGDARKIETIKFPSAYEVALKKCTSDQEATVEERFNDMVRRADLATKEIIKEYKIICHFIRRGNPAYKIKSKPRDMRILLEIDATTFLPCAYLSGNTPNLCGLLGVPYGNRSLLVWKEE